MKILYNSLSLAKSHPSVFIPKIISVTLGSIWILGLINAYGDLIYYALLAPFILYFNFFTSVWVAKLSENPEQSLKTNFFEILKLKTRIFYGFLALTLFTSIISLPLLAAVLILLFTDLFIFGVSIGIIGVFLIFAAAFHLYFLPISLIKNEKIISIVKDSAKTSSKHNKEVLAIFLVSVALLVLGSLSEGLLRELTLIGFILGRAIEAVVSTYIFLVSSRYYLNNKNS